MRRPITKNCPFCGRFMTLSWVPADLESLPPGLDTSEDYIPVFMCFGERCPREGLADNESLLPYYRYLIYMDPGREYPEYLDEAKRDLPEEDWLAMVEEFDEMKRLFENRPYRAIPVMTL